MVRRFMLPSLAIVTFAAIGTLPARIEAQSYQSRQAAVAWQTLAIGAGGQLTGIDIAPDGTKVVKADAFGAYIWNSTLKRWIQLITASSGAVTTAHPGGVWDIRIAPSLTHRLFMIYDNSIYRSDNRGASWIKTGMPKMSGAGVNEANGHDKFANQKLAVDPANPDVVYSGTPKDGAWRSYDAGTTWSRIKEIIPGTSPGNAGIAFDPNSGTEHGRTKTIYIPSYGHGVWLSTDAGKTWTQIAGTTQGGPSQVWTAQVGADGTYWCSEHGIVWKYSGGIWTQIFGPVGRKPINTYAVVVDPKLPGRVIFLSHNAKVGRETLDNGTTLVGNTWFPKYPKPGINQVATDIPWLQESDTNYMTLGDAKIDPTNGRLYIAQGIGVWWTDWPKTFNGFTYYSQSRGIEELVTNEVVVPPGGKPITATWDRAFFRSDEPKKFPTKYGPVNGAFAGGWSLDYASAKPLFVVGIANWWGKDVSGYSPDAGQTWRTFATHPPVKLGGSIAAATISNFIWVPGDNNPPYYTKDGGVTWKLVPELPTEGWIRGFFLKRRIVVADRANIGTFYLYNFKHGLFRSTDGGDHWSLVYRGELARWSGGSARLRATPGRAGDLWFTSGTGYSQSHPAAVGEFRHSTDGGATWHTIPHVLEVIDFGFGKAKSPGGYPSIYIAGWVNSVYGIWRSDDEANTWTNIGKYPNDNIDTVTTITGDMDVYGAVYVGFVGSGFAYGSLRD